MPKRGKKGAVAEDGEEPKTEPEAKKSKVGVGAKKNEKEGAGEGPALYEDPPDQKTSPSGKSATLKICSWNVDGLRAWIKKKGLDWVKEEAPDILCLQETKCSENKLPAELQDLPGLSHQYWSAPSDKEGYSGVGLLSRQCPLKVSYGIGETLDCLCLRSSNPIDYTPPLPQFLIPSLLFLYLKLLLFYHFCR